MCAEQSGNKGVIQLLQEALDEKTKSNSHQRPPLISPSHITLADDIYHARKLLADSEHGNEQAFAHRY
jgi:hypothetical protein